MHISYELREKIEYTFWSLVILSFALGIGYLIYTHRDKPPSRKNEIWCASISFFNNKTHAIDTAYTTAVVFDSDSLVNFTDANGNIWWAKDFLTNEDRRDEDDISYDDITLKNGERYKVLIVSDGKCQVKSAEDSLKDNLSKSGNEDYN